MARILISGFCAVPGPTRSGVQLRQVVRALGGRHTVDLLAVREGDQAYVERLGSGRLLRVPTHDADLATQVQAFQRALRRQLEGADYDVVHCRDGWSARPVLEGRDRFGYAVVYDLTRAPMAERDALGPELGAAHDRDEEALLVGADLVLVPTEPARRYAIGRGAPDRVLLAPPGVDVDRFDWDVAPADAPPMVLYAGTLAPNRGVRLLLRAMVEVLRTIAARVVLVGPIAPGFDGPLRAAIHELGLTGKVDIKGPIDHDLMPAMIGRATVCVAPNALDLPRRPYALYPTKLLEYLACRRAVLAPRRGAVTALIDHGREGLLFQPGDASDLARKLVRLLEDRGLRERLAATGYERVRREFTASAARRAITGAYLRLASRSEWAARFLEVSTGVSQVTPPPAATSTDDDFEATVFETTPPAPGTGSIELPDPDVALVGDSSSPALDAALAGLTADADGDGDVDVDVEVTDDADDHRTPRPAEDRGDTPMIEEVGYPGEETQERTVAPRPSAGAAMDGNGLVAGEIDVPTPTPELVDDDAAFTRQLGTEPR